MNNRGKVKISPFLGTALNFDPIKRMFQDIHRVYTFYWRQIETLTVDIVEVPPGFRILRVEIRKKTLILKLKFVCASHSTNSKKSLSLTYFLLSTKFCP